MVGRHTRWRHAAVVAAMVAGLWASAAGAGEAYRASDELIDKLANGGVVYTFEKHDAFMDVDATGNGGSRSRLRVRFEGLYVVPEPHLSWFLREGTPGATRTRDTYWLYPKKISVSTQATIRQGVRTQSATTWGEVHNTHTWSYRHSYDLPEPPAQDAGGNAVGQWKRKVSELHRLHGYTGLFIVADRRAAGGSVSIHPSFSLLDRKGAQAVTTSRGYNGTLQRSYHVSRTLRSALAQGLRSNSPLVSASGPIPESLNRADFHSVADPAACVVLPDFSLEELTVRGEGTAQAEVGFYTANQRPGHTVTSDSRCTVRYRYGIGLRTEVDAVLEPHAANEATFLPNFDEVRLYRLTINQPDPSQVEAVRFGLVLTSDHPGIATNAGNHCLSAGDCTDCTTDRARQTHSRRCTVLGQSTTRTYDGYNACRIDELPDCFFRDSDNLDYELGDDKTKEGLEYTISQGISRKGTGDKEYLARLAIKDTGASTRLYAEVLVNGWWYPARAQGKTADTSGEMLLIPLDKNGNDCADAWDAANGTSGGNDNATEDKDASHNAGFPGDGLSVFEEYRGVFVKGDHKRTSPKTTDLFVHDHTGQYGVYLEEVGLFYRDAGIQVWRLNEDEFQSDVVNYQSTRHTLGQQYNVVVMRNWVVPADVGYREFRDQWNRFAGRAADFGPPRAQANTVLINYEPLLAAGGVTGDNLTGLLGHEVGHMIGCHHHGEKDGFVDLPATTVDSVAFDAGTHFCAVRGGQHSGHCECFMRYNVAKLFCEADAVQLPFEAHRASYRALPQSSKSRCRFCNSPTGTDINSGGQWCGDAERGACRQQIRIRSYR
ncbi:hypothetical protein HQ576_07715 [bacterium]|nr:hypothetical protein [bacterium]